MSAVPLNLNARAEYTVFMDLKNGFTGLGSVLTGLAEPLRSCVRVATGPVVGGFVSARGVPESPNSSNKPITTIKTPANNIIK